MTLIVIYPIASVEMISIHLTTAVQADICEKAAPLAKIIQILTTRRGRYIENKSIFQRTIRKLITTHAGLVHAICHPLSVLSTKMRQSEAFCININFIAYTQRCSVGISTDSAQTDGRKYVGTQTILIFIILAGNDFVRWWTLFGPLVFGGAGGRGRGGRSLSRQLPGVTFSLPFTAPATMTNYEWKVE